MNTKENLKSMSRNSIILNIAKEEEYKLCGTRFGGKPDVPQDFVWPTYEGENYEGEIKNRPLSFLAQFNCEELAEYDTEHLLPDHGILSFFYETDTQPWGFDPKDKGAARVFWFEDTSELSAADFPEDMEDDFKFPMTKINLTKAKSLPCWEDFANVFSEIIFSDDDSFDSFNEIREELGVEEPEECSKLLGWADIIQSSMPVECDLVSQGYYLGGGWDKIPKEVVQRAEDTAIDRWVLLFQLDVVENGDFELMFGDCGRIYFYITKEDLLQRRFDKVWQILQCY